MVWTFRIHSLFVSFLSGLGMCHANQPIDETDKMVVVKMKELTKTSCGGELIFC